MSALQVILVLGVSLLLIWVMVTAMVRVDRRAAGAIPEDEPNFTGCGAG